MFASRPAVHPVEAPPLTEAAGLRVRMKDVQGMPGTPGGLVLRLLQFVFAAIAVSVMASTSDFHEATAFCYLVLALGLQSLWSLSLLVLDIYAILVRRSLRNDKLPLVTGIPGIWPPLSLILSFHGSVLSAFLKSNNHIHPYICSRLLICRNHSSYQQ
ncbi:CASP-like protein 5A1 isoform X4 [Citrus sinensis]|uniref:CASP-like protein 5A1 isoform X4 n=1 Tax=Citrus sinensis TaxID=2711 RepID=UPI000D62C19D|nr:CASP-like protein 5A1 isoform X4 [Citrus sinensis]